MSDATKGMKEISTILALNIILSGIILAYSAGGRDTTTFLIIPLTTSFLYMMTVPPVRWGVMRGTFVGLTAFSLPFLLGYAGIAKLIKPFHEK